MAIAGLFPGQGSQSIGMLSELSESFAQVNETYQEASEALGYDLWKVVQEGPESQLNSTETTQPAMLAAGVAVWRVWLAQDGKAPVAAAGHSLGEYSALVAANVLPFADGIKLVAERGRLMQSAVPAGEGAMAAVLGLDDDQIRAACESASSAGVVEAVNYNSPGQVVIAGAKAAVEQALEEAKALGAKKAVALPVSVPSHCQLMKPAAEALAESLKNIELSAADFAVLHNVDAQVSDNTDAVRVALAEQLYHPVLWVDTVNALRQNHQAEIMLEFGPGKVLTGLNRRIERRMKAAAIFDNKSLESALALCEE